VKRKRNYKKEYKNYHGKPEQIKRRDSRNAARNLLKKKGVNVKGKDVAHKNGNPKDNRLANLTTKSASKNRSTKKKSKSTVNKAGNYTKPEMRKRIFNRIKAGGKGGAPGQWSARKAQMLAVAYKKAGGGYRG